MNGWDGCGGPIWDEGGCKQGMGVLTGARATIFDTGDNGRKTAKEKEQ